MKTKWIFTILLGVFFSLFTLPKANACDIEFEIIKGKKESYKAGDTLIVEVKVALTHRACPVKLNATKFKLNGLKVIKATKWKEVSANNWERKLMVVVTKPKGKNVSLAAIRECNKDGGYGILKLNLTE